MPRMRSQHTPPRRRDMLRETRPVTPAMSTACRPPSGILHGRALQMQCVLASPPTRGSRESSDPHPRCLRRGLLDAASDARVVAVHGSRGAGVERDATPVAATHRRFKVSGCVPLYAIPPAHPTHCGRARNAPNMATAEQRHRDKPTTRAPHPSVLASDRVAGAPAGHSAPGPPVSGGAGCPRVGRLAPPSTRLRRCLADRRDATRPRERDVMAGDMGDHRWEGRLAHVPPRAAGEWPERAG